MNSPSIPKARYQIRRLLGQGGMGEVYLAWDEGRQEEVALKFLSEAPHSQMFREEVRFLTKLSHPNLISLYDFHEKGCGEISFEASMAIGDRERLDQAPFFSMEWLETPTLDRDTREFSHEQWIRYLVQAAQGLNYLHRRRLLHGDLKPANLLIDKRGELKILDFGLAALRSSTHSGPAMGSPAYLPAEAFWGEYDESTDLYSLGVSFFEKLTGSLPGKIPLKTIRPELPDFFCDLVQRLISPRRDKRPRSALALIRFLNQHVEDPFPIQEADDLEMILKKPPFTGRDAEWKTLQTSFAAVADRQSPALLGLEGPTGVGRSRLLQEWIWELRLQGASCFAFTESEAEAWWRPPPGESRLAYFRKLAESPSVGPEFWCFRDLHATSADYRKKLLLLLSLTLPLPRPRLIVLEWNSELTKEDFSSWIKKMSDEFPMETIHLRDFSPKQTRLFLQGAAAEFSLPETKLEKIVEASGGRPLLALEILRQVLQMKPGESVAEEVPISHNLQEAVVFRLGHLARSAQKLLGLLVTAKGEVEEERLRRSGKFHSEEFLLARHDLEDFSFLSPRAFSTGSLGLAHPSLAAVIRKSLDPAILREAHDLWLKSYCTDFPQAVDHPDIISLFGHAQSLDDRETMKKYGMVAARQCQIQGEEQKAIAIFETLLSFAEDPEDRVTLHAYLAPAYYQLAQYEKSLAAYDKWFAERQDDETFLQKLKHRFYTGLVYFYSGKSEAAKRRLDEALVLGKDGAHPPHRPYLVRAHNLLAVLKEREGRESEVGKHLEFAKSLAEGDALSLGDIEHRLGNWNYRRFAWREAAEAFEKSARHYAQAGNAQGEAIPWNALAMLRLSQGRYREARVSIERALSLAERGQDALQWARYRENFALILLESSDYAAATRLFEESEGLLKIFGQASDRPRAHLHRARMHLLLGRPEVAERIVTELSRDEAMLREAGILPEARILAAELAYQKNQFEEAGRIFAEISGPELQAGAYETILAKVGMERSRREGPVDPPLEGPTTITNDGVREKFPPSLDSSWWETCETLFAFTRKPDDEINEDELLDIMEKIRAGESPERVSEMLALLKLDLKRRGFSSLESLLAHATFAEHEKIYQQLPEELQMDYEKKGGLASLDQKISQWMPQKPVAAPAIPEVPTGQVISEARFRQFSEINRQIAEKTNLTEILERVMDAAIEFTGAERGFLLWKSEAKESLLPGFEVKTARHLSQVSLKAEEFKISRTVLQRAVEMGSYLLIENAQQDTRFQEKKSVVLYQLLSILVVPMQLSGQILGIIYLDHRYQPACFTTEHVLLLNAFASQAALAIQKAQMLETISKARDRLEIEVRDQAIHIENLTGELAKARSMLRYEYSEIVGQSPAMMRVFQLLDHVTETSIPVWIRGESGTGKELIARSLHFNSPRKSGAFVAENCSAIPENLLESELFGHKKGAFTHADRDRVGLFEQAHGGTLFLDEIADMSLAMQAKLLRVLQEGEVRPVGSSKKIKVDVRLVTASNRDLNQMVKEDKFRQDLFFRLNGLTIQLPPLRSRTDDIPILVEHFVKRIAKDYNLTPGGVSDEAFQVMMDYPWPGNIRELEAVIRNAMLFAKGRTITPEFLTLNPTLSGTEVAVVHSGSLTKQKISQSGEKEKKKLLDLMRRYRLDKNKVAESLGISLRNLYTRLERLGLPKKKSQLERYLQM